MPDRRAEILRAALAAFVHEGYERTSIERVRELSGASTGSIYHHFEDKAGIATALYLECLADYHRGLPRVLGAGTGAEDGVRGLVRHHLRWVVANPDAALFLLERGDVAELAHQELRELNASAFATVRRWLEPHVAEARIRRMPLELLYAVVLGPGQEHARRMLRGRSSVSAREAERTLSDTAWAAVAIETTKEER